MFGCIHIKVHRKINLSVAINSRIRRYNFFSYFFFVIVILIRSFHRRLAVTNLHHEIYGECKVGSPLTTELRIEPLSTCLMSPNTLSLISIHFGKSYNF